MAKIGFIGLGHMGLPMAKNLLKAGHQVTGYDLQADTLQQLQQAGGVVAVDLSQALLNQDVVITMLPSDKQVNAVCLGTNGLYNVQSSALHIDCSSIDAAACCHLHQEAKARNIMTVDAPVSGGVKGAEAAGLTFMVGGDLAAFERAKPILACMGKKIIHTGKGGSGQAAKICNNMVLGITMIAVSEAFVLARQLGLSAEKLHEVISNASGQCWVTDKYLPVGGIIPNVPADNHFQPGFTVAMMLKDLNLSQAAAEKTDLHPAMGSLATKVYQQFLDQGYGELDFSAIINQVG